MREMRMKFLSVSKHNEGLEAKVTQSIMVVRLLTTSLWFELKCTYRGNNHENISDRELSLTTWILSVTIWANHHKPQFQRRYLGLQPFTFHPRIVLVLFYRIIREIIQNSLHRNKNREEVKNREIRYLPDLSIFCLRDTSSPEFELLIRKIAAFELWYQNGAFLAVRRSCGCHLICNVLSEVNEVLLIKLSYVRRETYYKRSE